MFSSSVANVAALASAAALAALSVPPAAADVLAVKRLIYDLPPLADIVPAHGISPGTPVLNSNPDQRPDIAGRTLVEGFETDAGLTLSLEGPVAASVSETRPEGIATPAGDRIRNFWVPAGQQTEGAMALIGLDVAVGVDNAVSVDVQFSGPVTGAAGTANDFLLVELFGDDSVEVLPLDVSGNVIGIGVVIASGPGLAAIETDDPGQWGWVGTDLVVTIENLPPMLFGEMAGEGAVLDNLKIAAVAFDVEDLFGGDSHTLPVHGLRILGIDLGSGKGTIDLAVVAANRSAFGR